MIHIETTKDGVQIAINNDEPATILSELSLGAVQTLLHVKNKLHINNKKATYFCETYVRFVTIVFADALLRGDISPKVTRELAEELLRGEGEIQ